MRMMSRHEKPWPNAENTGCVERDHPAQHQQQRDAEDQRQAQPDGACPVGLRLGQLADQHRDEDDVVDAEHHLHDGQGQQTRSRCLGRAAGRASGAPAGGRGQSRGAVRALEVLAAGQSAGCGFPHRAWREQKALLPVRWLAAGFAGARLRVKSQETVMEQFHSRSGRDRRRADRALGRAAVARQWPHRRHFRYLRPISCRRPRHVVWRLVFLVFLVLGALAASGLFRADRRRRPGGHAGGAGRSAGMVQPPDAGLDRDRRASSPASAPRSAMAAPPATAFAASPG